jgi:hypothetical protein
MVKWNLYCKKTIVFLIAAYAVFGRSTTSDESHIIDLTKQLKASVAFCTIKILLGLQNTFEAIKALASFINYSDYPLNHF